MTGLELITTFIAASGLPQSAALKELQALAIKAGKDIHSMNLDDIRELLADYLQEVLLQAKRDYSA